MADDSGGGRGFTLVVLEIDFAGVLTGSAHLTITPTNPGLRTVYLHASPLLQINNVTLSSPTPTNPLLPTPASYAVSNPFQPLPVREPPIDLKSHQEIKRKTWAALGERDEGELAVSVSHGWVRLLETEGVDGTAAVTLAPIHIQIDYQLVVGGDVVEGIVFRRPGDGGDDSQVPHMFLSPTTFDSARVWTPCIDSLWERCTWELEFIVPRCLEGGEPTGDEDAYPVMVVASGELIEQVTHPHDPNKVIFYYLQTSPATVQHISFAAGPFEMHQVPAMVGGENHKPMLAFCLPGQLEELITSTAFLCRAMSFYHTEFGSYPYSAFKMVFVSNPRSSSSVSVSMAIFSSDLLYPENIIDQAIDTRQALSLALIQQWVGVNIIQRTLSDTWLITGLMFYLHGHFIRHLLGNNEYRFRLKKDIDRCVHMDQGDQLPLCQPGAIDPPSAAAMSFMALKAPLVLHILDRYIVKSGTSHGLSRVIPRIFLASLSDELPGNMLSTAYFFRLCRKASGMDLLSFQDQWVYGSGCPHLTIKTNFIRKKFLVEFTVTQQQPALQAAESLDEKNKDKVLLQKRPTPFFEGSLTVRIHEADGAPFEHLVDIKTKSKMFPLPFNTKYKRTRRSGHVAARFSKLQDVLAQAEDNDDVEAEQLRDVDRGEVFAYPPWDNEEERRAWRVQDWSEEEAGAMLGESGGYEWIRVDPDLEWLAHFDIQEKPWFWISQLQGDRDVVAQLQAVQRMTLYHSPVIASELARTVLVENYFYRVRMEAARALVAYNTSEADYMGLFLLLKLFQTFYCHPTWDDDPLTAESHPLPNDFSNKSDYFLKKSIVTALAELRDPATRQVWRPVRKLLLNLLKGNDNSQNEWSDSYYLATVISAIGGAFAAGVNMPGVMISDADKEIDQDLYKEASDANERAMTVDRLVPSYHNVITEAGLQAQLKSIMVGQRTNDPRVFLSYTREGNYEPLRLLAFDALLLCKAPGRSLALAQYLFDVIRNDYSLTVRRHVSRAISESILMTLAVGEVYMNINLGVVEVNSDATPEQREKEREGEQAKIVKALRKEFNSKAELRKIVQEALLDSFTGNDHEILFALIKAAEVMSSGVPEPKPGVLITLNTPAETPVASTPKIRLSLTSASSEPKPDSSEFPFPKTEAPLVESPVAATPSTPIKLVLNPTTAPAKEKKKKQPKAQARGLPDQDFKAITIVLQKLLGDKRSTFFRQPVDPTRDNAPDYLAIVSRPMDLSTIRAKLDGGMYTTRKEFESDVRLLIANCYLYNPVASPVRKSGEAFEKYFNSVWSKTENTLRSANAAAELSSPKPTPEKEKLPAASPSSALMPPPPVPGSAGGVRIKLKPTKSVTLDVPPTPTPMAPPPVPKKKGAAPPPPEPAPPPPKEKERTGRKKRDKAAVDDELDDLLGAEVDAMENPVQDPFEDLLGPTPPTKKIKLSTKGAARDASPPPERSSKKAKKASTADSASSASSERTGVERKASGPSIKLKPSGEAPAIKLKTSEAAPTIKLKSSGDLKSRSEEKPRPTDRLWSTASSEKPRSSGEPSKSKEPAPRVKDTAKVKDTPRDKPRSTDSSKSSKVLKRDESAKPRSTDSSKARRTSEAFVPRGGSGSRSLSPRKSQSPAPPHPSAAGPSFSTAAAATPAPPQPGVPPGYHGYLPPPPPSWPQPPSNMPPTATNSMPFRFKRSKAMIQVLIKDPSAIYFLQPVDPERDGCPTYYDEIKHPSDYSTIMRNIDSKKYKTMGALANDIELIFAKKFNPPGAITDLAATNEALFWKEWPKAVSPRLAPDERKQMVALLNRALKDPVSLFFRVAVDPVALGIPQYFEIIPPEDARDLSLIKNKLEKSVYSTARQVDEDVDLMLENARVFNGDGDAVTEAANQFAAWWKQQRLKMDV